jgi:hypothetical protein
MIGVDLIGDIRRAYFDEGLPIKEIVRPGKTGPVSSRCSILQS